VLVEAGAAAPKVGVIVDVSVDAATKHLAGSG
jgi:hypothetical protein